MGHYGGGVPVGSEFWKEIAKGTWVSFKGLVWTEGQILSALVGASSAPESNHISSKCSLLAPLQPHELVVSGVAAHGWAPASQAGAHKEACSGLRRGERARLLGMRESAAERPRAAARWRQRLVSSE